jgi:uncharacterized membrane protein YeaQ/YmgE (transglycosylase-associated protein family)
MGWIIAILVGALVGWLASIIMKTDAQQGPILNIVIGIVGATLARWLFGDVLGIGGTAAGTLSITGILWGLIGAVVLIFILKAVRVLK